MKKFEGKPKIPI